MLNVNAQGISRNNQQIIPLIQIIDEYVKMSRTALKLDGLPTEGGGFLKVLQSLWARIWYDTPCVFNSSVNELYQPK